MPIPDRSYGSTGPFADPYTEAQHADIAHSMEAAKRADAAYKAAVSWQRACGASLQGDEQSASGFRSDALVQLHPYPSLRIEITGAWQPIITDHADAIVELKRARAILQRVHDSTLSGTEREMRMTFAMTAIDKDLAALEAGQ